jgi:hypothetical protein
MTRRLGLSHHDGFAQFDVQFHFLISLLTAGRSAQQHGGQYNESADACSGHAAFAFLQATSCETAASARIAAVLTIRPSNWLQKELASASIHNDGSPPYAF